jgi:leucyl/phenylalanyl-tRNA--protein transferase
VTLGGLFAGESMFSRVRDASKVALVHLMTRLREREYALVDIQYVNDHTRSLGAIEIPREEYRHRLAEAVTRAVTFV